MNRIHFVLIILFYTLLCGCASTANKQSQSSIGNSQKQQLAEANIAEAMKFYALENYTEAKVWFEKTLGIDPNAAAANYMLGKLSLREGKLAEALAYSQKAVNTGIKNRYYFQQLAQTYEAQNNFKEAAKIYQQLITEIPHSEEHYYDLATDYILLQNFEEALKAYAKIETIFGMSPELTRQKQQLFLKMNKLEQALAEGDAYIKEHPDDLEFRLSQAEILYTNGKSIEAVTLLEELIKADPNYGEARFLLFGILKTKNEHEKAKAQLDQIFSNPYIAIDTKLAILQELSSDRNEDYKKNAIRYAQQNTSVHPSESKAYHAYGDFLMTENKKEEAWKNYIKANTLNKTDFHLWSKLIQLDGQLNQLDSMVLHTEKALEAFPNQAALWLYNGTAYQLKKKPEKAIEAFEEGKRLALKDPQLQLEFNARLGDCYQELRNYIKSDAAYDDALRIDRNYDYVLNNYSYYLSLRKDKLELAKEMSGRLIKKHPYEATYIDTHAWVLYMMKDYQGAKKYLEIAVTNSNNGTIVEHYGDVLFQLGEKDLAVAQWEKAKKLGETSELIDKKIRDKTLYE